MKETVVILLSDKRSGSTMFEWEFCRHPDVNHVFYTSHTYNETHYWLKAACLLPTPQQLFYGNKCCKGYGSKAEVRKSIIDGIRRNVPDFKVPDDDESLIFNGWNALCDKYATPVFFEKSPQHPHHWAALDLMLKWAAEKTDCRVLFIGLVRNPMAVMYSAQQLFYTNPSERQFSWAVANRNILLMKEMLTEDQFHLLRYEDLIENPMHILIEICNFIGIEYRKPMGEAIHKKSINKWYDDPLFGLQLHDSVVRLARHLGYSENDLYNPPKPKPTAFQKISRGFKFAVRRIRSRTVNRIKRFLNFF